MVLTDWLNWGLSGTFHLLKKKKKGNIEAQ